jgi:hypothetical protein
MLEVLRIVFNSSCCHDSSSSSSWRGSWSADPGVVMISSSLSVLVFMHTRLDCIHRRREMDMRVCLLLCIINMLMLA